MSVKSDLSNARLVGGAGDEVRVDDFVRLNSLGCLEVIQVYAAMVAHRNPCWRTWRVAIDPRRRPPLKPRRAMFFCARTSAALFTSAQRSTSLCVFASGGATDRRQNFCRELLTTPGRGDCRLQRFPVRVSTHLNLTPSLVPPPPLLPSVKIKKFFCFLLLSKQINVLFTCYWIFVLFCFVLLFWFQGQADIYVNKCHLNIYVVLNTWIIFFWHFKVKSRVCFQKTLTRKKFCFDKFYCLSSFFKVTPENCLFTFQQKNTSLFKKYKQKLLLILFLYNFLVSFCFCLHFLYPFLFTLSVDISWLHYLSTFSVTFFVFVAWLICLFMFSLFLMQKK